MHIHSHGVDEGRKLRPMAGRIESDGTGAMRRAVAVARPEVLGSVGLLGLQRTVGNAGVTRVVEQQCVAQRQEAENEEPQDATVQGDFVQRAEAEDETPT